MNQESVTSFITYYLQSLNERTRREKSGAKWGIDWVAYNLGLAQFGKPVRLPFLRSGTLGYPTSKSEAEFGIDLAFLSGDGRNLTIFVLKDEPLTNRTWTDNDFERDLRMAMSPDLNAEGLEEVTCVTIILAYNKDDHQNGIEAYKRFVDVAPTKLRDHIELRFDRWNLSELVAQTIAHILSPSLLPERFFGQLSYLAAQVSDFRHGSDPWELQLVPNWKRFLDDVLEESAGMRGPALIPVVLIILRQHAQANPSLETGWIDLLEWAALALWNLHQTRPDPNTLEAIQRFWSGFYMTELDRFYRTHIGDLAAEHAIDQVAFGSYIGAVASSYVAYWQIARLGLLSMHIAESSKLDRTGEARHNILNKVTNWTAMLTKANVTVFRPMLDIQHIQIFLLVEIWRNAERISEVGNIFEMLVERLYLRRLGYSNLPFLDGGNSLEHVFEQLATRPDHPLVQSQSSFFVLMLLELCCLLPDESRDQLLCLIHRRLVLGAFDAGDPGPNRPLHLMSWIPPEDWDRKVLRGERQGGQSIAVQPFAEDRNAKAADILRPLRELVTATRKIAPLRLPKDIPVTAVILASLRHEMPLHPELWRQWTFPELNADN